LTYRRGCENWFVRNYLSRAEGIREFVIGD
jgi:hypothetical protein